jgi:cytochrome d ubiquinol oxidase subunit I
MAYLGSLLVLLGLWGLWRRKRLATSRWFLRVAIWAVPIPFVVNTAGWLLTENGRQPWIVQGLQLTRDASSPSVGTAALVTSLAVFVLLYGLLAVVAWSLMLRYARREPPDEPAPEDTEAAPRVPVTSY